MPLGETEVSDTAIIKCSPWQAFDWEGAGPISALITDPPYSAKTESGSRSSICFDSSSRRTGHYSGSPEHNVDYGHIVADDAVELAAVFSGLVKDWAVIFCDHVAWQWHAKAWEECGWYVFAPVPWLKRNGAPRFQGDGPASMTEWLMIARPRKVPSVCFSRSGYYETSIYREQGARRRAGHKAPQELVRLVNDYSEPGDLVADPFAGTATVGSACIRRGRRYVGTEVDEEACVQAERRLLETPPPLPGLTESRRPTQLSMEEL